MKIFHNKPRKSFYEPQKQANEIQNKKISTTLSENLVDLYTLFTHTPDLIVRHLDIQKSGEKAVLIYLASLTNTDSVHDHILRPLIYGIEDKENPNLPVSIGHVGSSNHWTELENSILQGKSVLLVEGRNDAMTFDTQGWPERAIEDPQLEASLKGAHQGFVETGSRNIALIRRYITSRELKIKEMIVGRRGKCKVSIMYLEDVAHPEVLQELEDRIRRLDVDAILNAGELEEFIEDNTYSPFPQFISTERPDAAASHILEGRFVVMVDGSPSALVAPVTLVSFFQNVDDYGSRFLTANFIRLLRLLAFFVAILLPSLYISIISFNYELIPVKLLLNIGKYRAEVPFPPLIEALIMEIALEMLREAGIRLPAPIGQTVGIVGAIVIGQAAVQAGIVSNMMIIVVASTAIASFIIPNYDMSSAIRLLRFPMMLLASFFGIVGIVVGLLTLIGHLISLESLGNPYSSPFAPVYFSDWKDSFLRVPLWKMNRRPLSARAIQAKKQGSNHPRGDGK
ncbi:spore germination protein [Neobacillus ginsengisoli]|uniref:Spore germination protein n=1 Tax=Neobacillus ginsengisoli TaxID=904295 RepID=A0ABT9Y182_9BACI|nr:spore germination protein [Neobacillus ginsengisoli]MDQ0201506.1 spore germination protein [Neobacillus ginsengisoli]